MAGLARTLLQTPRKGSETLAVCAAACGVATVLYVRSGCWRWHCNNGWQVDPPCRTITCALAIEEVGVLIRPDIFRRRHLAEEEEEEEEGRKKKKKKKNPLGRWDHRK